MASFTERHIVSQGIPFFLCLQGQPSREVYIYLVRKEVR